MATTAPPSPCQPPTKEEGGAAGGKKQFETKKCGVCGDKALGYNFNAITCESCKAFFRRNALKNKEFKCPFQGECQVDQVTRRFCQRCRLRKCFEIGMKKEWIMSEEEKRKKKRKIEENRASRRTEAEEEDTSEGSSNSNNNNNNSNNDNCSSDVDVPVPPPPPLPPEVKPQAVVVGIIRGNNNNDNDDNNTSFFRSPKRRREDEADDDDDDLPTSHNIHSSLRESQSEYQSNFTPNNSFTREQGESSQVGSGGGGASSPPCGADNPSLEEVVAISIKKEIDRLECDRVVSLGNNHNNNLSLETHTPPPPPPPHHQYHIYHTSLPEPPHHHETLYHHHHHIPSPPPPLPQHSTTCSYHTTPPPPPPPPPHHHQNADKCEEFSVREAMKILHPQEEAKKESSSVMDTLMNTAIRAEYFSPLLSPTTQLNEAERAKLEELTEANKGLLAPLCEDYNFKDMSNPSLINVINLTEIAIRRLIKMAKRISSFKTLCQEDQIALLKGGCTEMMILRSVCAYDPDKDSWKIQQDHSKTQDIKLKVLKAAPGNVYEEHKRFILAFEPEWRKDPHIIFLLCAITLFSPRRPHIIHADAILHEQCSYLYLTRRYLAARYNPCAGRAVYHQLLHRLAHLHRLSEEHVRLFLEVNPKQVEPLLIEIFDLKQ